MSKQNFFQNLFNTAKNSSSAEEFEQKTLTRLEELEKENQELKSKNESLQADNQELTNSLKSIQTNLEAKMEDLKAQLENQKQLAEKYAQMPAANSIVDQISSGGNAPFDLTSIDYTMDDLHIWLRTGKISKTKFFELGGQL